MDNDTVGIASHAAPDTGNAYTAVVYFHGIGSQRRYEETSRLIDAMDALLTSDHLEYAENPALRDTGLIRKIETFHEPDHEKPDATVTAIRARYFPPGAGNGVPGNEVRFYEAYWAPIMAGHATAWGVVKWAVSQVGRPFRSLWAGWRVYPRARRAALADLEEIDARETLLGSVSGHTETLLRAYEGFCDLEAMRRYPRQGFADFQNHLESQLQDHSESDRAEILALARKWKRHFRLTEWKNAIALVTLLVFLLAVAWTLNLLLGWFYTNLLPQTVQSLLKIGSLNSSALLAAAATAFGVNRLLTDKLGDVQAWGTYQETSAKYDMRKRVIETGTTLLRHVLADKNCARVVIVSHSLGTSVAYDVLLALRKCNLMLGTNDAMNGVVRLEKILHLVTLASPVDKINYFFESQDTRSHRYAEVVEDLRGDMGAAPFSWGPSAPHMHWINYWDEADVISGPLHSPLGRKCFANRVDNVHVPILKFPWPGRAHDAYFSNPMVIRGITDIVCHNKAAFAGSDLPLKDAAFGPGAQRGSYRHAFRVAFILAWCAGLAVVFHLAALTDWSLVFLAGTLVAATALVLLAFTDMIGPRQADPERTSGERDPGTMRRYGSYAD
jgi:hypothetical protein